MPRILSLNLRYEKNHLASTHPWTMLFELTITGAGAPFRLAAYDQDVVFHGLTYTRFPIDVDLLEEPTHASLVNLRVTVANIDQQIQSLLENFWVTSASPDWTVTIWQIDPVQPNETPFSAGEVFSVQQVTTDFLTATFDLVSEGLTLTTIIPKRRFVSTNGFQYIPRAGR